MSKLLWHRSVLWIPFDTGQLKMFISFYCKFFIIQQQIRAHFIHTSTFAAPNQVRSELWELVWILHYQKFIIFFFYLLYFSHLTSTSSTNYLIMSNEVFKLHSNHVSGSINRTWHNSPFLLGLELTAEQHLWEGWSWWWSRFWYRKAGQLFANMIVLQFQEKSYISNTSNRRPDSPSSTAIAPTRLSKTLLQQDKDWIAIH